MHFFKMIFFLVSQTPFQDISETSVTSLDFDIRVLPKNNGWFAFKSVFLLLRHPVVMFPWSAVCLKALLLRPNICRIVLNAISSCDQKVSSPFKQEILDRGGEPSKEVIFVQFFVLSGINQGMKIFLTICSHCCLCRINEGCSNCTTLVRGGGAMGVHFLESKKTVLDDSGPTINGPSHFLPLPPHRRVYLSAKRR